MHLGAATGQSFLVGQGVERRARPGGVAPAKSDRALSVFNQDLVWGEPVAWW